MFRFLIDANQFHYQVEGYQEDLAAKDLVPLTAPSSVGSLPLKPDKGALVKIPQTPSRTEESVSDRPGPGEFTRASEEPCNDEIQAAVPGPSRHDSEDALDEVIKEAKALAHLVSYARNLKYAMLIICAAFRLRRRGFTYQVDDAFGFGL